LATQEVCAMIAPNKNIMVGILLAETALLKSPYFQVLLHGEDFIFNFDGERENGGFYTTRWVKAETEKEAELNAVELIKQDQHLHQLSVKGGNNSPMIYLDDICIVSWFKYMKNKPGKGYSFYGSGDS
jgi:hypothetical protein